MRENIFELRSSSLDSLGKTNLLDSAADFPIQSFRLLLRKLQQAGFTVDESDAKLAIHTIKNNMRQDSRNSWFSDTSNIIDEVTVTNKKTSGEARFRVRLYQNKFFLWITSVGIFSKEISIKIKNRSANEIFDKVVNLINRLTTEIKKSKSPSVEEYERNKEKAKEILGSEEKPLIIDKIDRIAKKFRLQAQRESSSDRKTISIRIRPNESLWGIKTGYSKGIMTHLPHEFESRFGEFTYKYQLEDLKRALPHILRRLKSSKAVITDGLNWGTGFVWLYIDFINRDRKSVYNNMTYAENEEKSIKRFYEILDKRIEEATGTLQEAKRSLVQGIFKYN